MNQEQPPLNIDEVDSSSNPNRHRFPVGKKIAAIGAGTLLLIGIGKGISNGESKAPDHPGQTASESYTPPISPSPTSVETQTPPTSNEKLIDFNSFGISADKYKTPEEITDAFINNYNSLLNAGFTKPYNSLLNPGIVDTLVKGFETTIDAKIIPKMFTESSSGQELSTAVENNLRKASIELYAVSARSPEIAAKNEELYKMKVELIKKPQYLSTNPQVVIANDTSIVVRTEEQQTDNGNKNNTSAYQIEHGQPGQMDITVYREITFVLDATTNTWKVDRITFWMPLVDNSK